MENNMDKANCSSHKDC